MRRVRPMTLEELVERIQQRKAFVYHFTEVRNLPSIREHGLLAMAEIRRRSLATIPGGNEWSLDADRRVGMDEYVHLCFMKDHPMEYYAKKEGRVVNIRYLQVDPSIILHEGALIADQVSNKRGARPESARVMFSKIDWKVLYDKADWRDPKIQARLKIAKVCELLIPAVVPVEFIKNI
jgi:hypothetical protein